MRIMPKTCYKIVTLVAPDMDIYCVAGRFCVYNYLSLDTNSCINKFNMSETKTNLQEDKFAGRRPHRKNT